MLMASLRYAATKFGCWEPRLISMRRRLIAKTSALVCSKAEKLWLDGDMDKLDDDIQL